MSVGRPSVAQIAYAWDSMSKTGDSSIAASTKSNDNKSQSKDSTPEHKRKSSKSRSLRRKKKWLQNCQLREEELLNLNHHSSAKDHDNMFKSMASRRRLLDGQQRKFLQQIKRLEEKLQRLSEEHSKLNLSRINRIKNHEEEIHVLTASNKKLCIEKQMLAKQLQEMKATENDAMFRLSENVEIEKARRLIEAEKLKAALETVKSLKKQVARHKKKEELQLQRIQQLSIELGSAHAALSAKAVDEQIAIGEAVDFAMNNPRQQEAKSENVVPQAVRDGDTSSDVTSSRQLSMTKSQTQSVDPKDVVEVIMP